MGRKIIHRELTSELIDLDATKASEFLELNKSNRPYRQNLALRYRDQLLAGQWRVNLPVVVYIDKHGDLHNGQHTCHAVKMAEEMRLQNPDLYAQEFGIKHPISLKAVVVYGIDADDANLLDVGQKRTHADVVFRQHLFKSQDWSVAAQKQMATDAATATKIVYFRLAYGEKVRSAIKFEHADMLEVLESHPGIQESIEFVYALDNGKETKGNIRSFIQRSYLAAAHYLAWHSKLDDQGGGLRRKQADKFVELFATGEGLEKGNPVLVLRDKLATMKDASGPADLNARFDAIVLAFNAYIAKKNVARKDLQCKPEDYPVMGGLDVPPPEESIESEEEPQAEETAETAAE